MLNVGGRLGHDENGVLKYSDSETNSFEPLDVDLLSIPKLESMMKSLGYPNYSALYWLEPNGTNLEFGLREIKKESDINELRKSLLENDYVDFQIYVEHPVSNPIIAEGDETVYLDSDADSKSSSHDSYESIEDEAYKPPPDGYELSSDSDDGESKKVKKRGRTKKILTPTKKASPKKNEKNTPIGRSSRRLGGDDKDTGDGFVDETGGKKNDVEAIETLEEGNGCNGPKGAARVVEPIVEEVDSEEDKEYAYESEAFVSPFSIDEDGYNRHKWTQHDTSYGYGKAYFELGMEFDRMVEFRDALKDYFVFEGK
ncbi:hypothetical protein PIB30_069664 [Stylosanthes scabra]|uniref:PB1-like domain-containing protein n=1 Tax=Stylosanthes scabra TaxID=79078 RepID=A0ABU6QNA7_9FABA|nr:hypothetical protein [Stylosanthes scabra]